jgi:glycosyltransferase involved in cell wall biosynthesis
MRADTETRRRTVVGIDARSVSGINGGVESVVIGLASGLTKLSQAEPDAPEHYLFMVYPGHDAWLRPFIGGRCSIVQGRTRAPHETSSGAIRYRAARASPRLQHVWRTVRPPRRLVLRGIPSSDRTMEDAGVSVIHFPLQSAFRTALPSIYHPHDLQYRHLPEFFQPRTRAILDVRYRAFCKQAEIVAVTSEWARQDIIQSYRLPADKVRLIPWAPVTTAYPSATPSELRARVARYDLPARFILFPAQTWPHKNHERLLEALATLRKRGMVVPLVSTGRLNEHYGHLRARVDQLGLNEQTYWLGFVDPLDLLALYRSATAVVVPTLFEAASGPVWEAFSLGVPVACSAVTSLPNQVGDAGLLFDPTDVDAIATAVERLWNDPDLRKILISRGRRQVERFTWDQTARSFRAHYRLLSRRRLSDEDRGLIAAAAVGGRLAG